MFKQNELIQATQGQLLHSGVNRVFRSLSIDSRSVRPGGVFIAIKGNRFDGHSFVKQAIKKGAAALIVSKEVKVQKKKEITVIKVKDTTVALGQIASFHRSRFNIPIIAITGSAGKTSTKELIAQVLKSKYKVFKNDKSENNQFGVPLTLLKLRKSHAIAIIELGTNRPGDIAWLSEVAKPTVAVFTNIGESHLERLKSKKGVFAEKKQLLRFIPQEGHIIFNEDDPYLRKIRGEKIAAKKINYSIKHSSQFQAKNIRCDEKGRIAFIVNSKSFVLRSMAQHNVYNALVAICCGRLFKISYNSINTIIYKQKNTTGRQNIIKAGKRFIIDDTYNSNPVSLRSAIKTLDSLRIRKGAKKFLIIADMLELGKNAKQCHEQMAKHILKTSIDYVFTKGKYSKLITRILDKTPTQINAFHCENFAQMNRQIRKRVSPSDILLVKGSRSMHMEKVVEYLMNHL